MYKEPFKLQLPDKTDRYRTICGSLLSCITVLFLLLYAIYKLSSLVDYKDFRIQEREQTNAFDANKSFGRKDGLAFAMGIIQWDDSDSPLEDPAYG